MANSNEDSSIGNQSPSNVTQVTLQSNEHADMIKNCVIEALKSKDIQDIFTGIQSDVLDKLNDRVDLLEKQFKEVESKLPTISVNEPSEDQLATEDEDEKNTEYNGFESSVANDSSEEADSEIEDEENAEDDQINAEAAENDVGGSPVNIKCGDIFKKHNKNNRVTDVMLDNDGLLLVASESKDILKFEQSGKYIGKIQVQQDVKVNRMHKMSNGNIVYSDVKGKQVVKCDDKFESVICSFGKGTLKDPEGLAVDETSKILYVADSVALCVFKFNVDDGRLLDTKIELKEKDGMMVPKDVTLTTDGNVIVAYGGRNMRMLDSDTDDEVETGLSDGKNHKIQISNMNSKSVMSMFGIDSNKDDEGEKYDSDDSDSNENGDGDDYDNNGTLDQIGLNSHKGQMIEQTQNAISVSKNHRVQMFSTNDKPVKILVEYGKGDGYVVNPHCVTIDEENMLIISSDDKLQLFDKDGKFIKRIDDKDDGLDIPWGNAVISNHPKRVAVANHGTGNVTIFHY